MKLKKRPKLIIALVAIILVIALAVVIAISFWPKEKAKEVKVLKSIDEYGYQLKDNKTKEYKAMFKELEKILLADEVDEEAYAKKLSEMFIYDFFSLEDKVTKTDIGGVDFVHPDAIANFMENAEDTYYKYIESNLYGERKQVLPAVETVTTESITPTEFAYKDEMHSAYEVKVNWTYTNDKFSDYQKTATVVLIKSGKIYYIVEM